MSEKTCIICGRPSSLLDPTRHCPGCVERPTLSVRPAEQAAVPLVEDPDAPDVLVGTELGGCRLLKRVGDGGMGTVYQAEQLSLGRTIALKVIHPHRSTPKLVARLHGEARVVASLSHPNILQVYDVGSAGGLHFIVLEYVDGPSLRTLIAEGLHEQPGRAIDILRQALMGLGHAHARGIVHRDIKPDNILLAGGGLVKLADFGLAKALDSDQHLTTTGVVIGTPHYMPPEAARGLPLDGRSDLYSLGATMYHALAGVPPFGAETAMGILYRHIHDTAPALDLVNPRVPAGVAALLARLMEKEPASRPATSEEALEALERALELSLAEGAFVPAIRRAGAAQAAPADGSARSLLAVHELQPGVADSGSAAPGLDSGLPEQHAAVIVEAAPGPTEALPLPTVRLGAIRRRSPAATAAAALLGGILLTWAGLQIRPDTALHLSATPRSARAIGVLTDHVAAELSAASVLAAFPGGSLAGDGPEAPGLEAPFHLAEAAVVADVASLEGLAAEARGAAVDLPSEASAPAGPEALLLAAVQPAAAGPGAAQDAVALVAVNLADSNESASASNQVLERATAFTNSVNAANWKSTAYYFPAKDCRFAKDPGEKRVRKALASVLGLPDGTRIRSLRPTGVRVEPGDGTARVGLEVQIEGRRSPYVVWSRWAKSCGRWRLEADPLQKGRFLFFNY
jgi:predicted Ser/Thr protein kinase